MKLVIRKLFVSLMLLVILVSSNALTIKATAEIVSSNSLDTANPESDFHQNIEQYLPAPNEQNEAFYANYSTEEIATVAASYEVVEMRTENTKTFEYEDKGVTYIFTSDVHAYNETTGQYEDVDSTLVKNGVNSYSPSNTNYDITVGEDMTVNVEDTNISVETSFELSFQEVSDNELIFTNSDNTIDLVIGVNNDTVNIDFYFYTPTTIDETITFNVSSEAEIIEQDNSLEIGNVYVDKPTYVVDGQQPVLMETKVTTTDGITSYQINLDGQNLTNEVAYPVNINTTARISEGKIRHNTVKEGRPNLGNNNDLQIGYVGYDDGSIIDGSVPWQQTRTYVMFETPNPNDRDQYPYGPYLSEEYVDITSAEFHVYQIGGGEAGDVINMHLITDPDIEPANENWDDTDWSQTTNELSWNQQTNIEALEYEGHSANVLGSSGWLEFDITESFADLVGEGEDGQVENRGYVLMMEDEKETESDTSYTDAIALCMKNAGNPSCPTVNEPYVTYTYTKKYDVPPSYPVNQSSVNLNPLIKENSNGTTSFDSVTAHGVTSPNASIKVDVVDQKTDDVVYTTDNVNLDGFYDFPDQAPAYNGDINDKDDISNWETASKIPRSELTTNTTYVLEVTFSYDGSSTVKTTEKFGYHTVVEGDTLESIMRQYGILGNDTLETQFLEDNHLSSSNDKIYIGDTLFIRQEAKKWDTNYNPVRTTPVPDAAPITIYAREVTPEIKYEKHVRMVEDPIVINTGNFTIDTYDFVISDGNYEYQFRRMYDSMGGGQIGSFGVNWSSMLDATLSFYPNGDIYFNYGMGGIKFVKSGNGYVSEVANNTYVLTKEGSKYVVTINENKELVFSSNGQLESIIYDNHKFTLTYDSLGNIKQITLPNDQVIKFTTNKLGMITKITLPDNTYVTYTYDEDNNLVKVTNQVGESMEYTYDDKHLLTSYTDYNGNTVITNEYDKYGRVISQTNADGNTATISYDDENLVNTVTDFDGKVTSYVLDDELAVVEIIGDVNETSVYDENLNIISYTYPSGDVITYDYNEDNLLVKETRSVDNKSQTYMYDQNNNVTQVTTYDGEVYQYTYDSYGNISSITYPDNTSEYYTYDSDGYKTSYIDQNGNVTTYEYNDKHQLVKDGVNSFSYDANGNITYLKVSNMGYTLTRDNLGRVTHITDDNGAIYTIRYDNNSNVIYEKNFVGQEYTRVYDASNNQIQKVYPDGSVEEFSYDDMGNVTTYTDQLGTTFYYEYDIYGNQVKMTNEDGIVISEMAFGTNQEQLYNIDQRGLKTTYVYDEYYNLVQEILPNGEIIYYEYDQNHNLVKKYSDTYVYETNTYNEYNQLVSQEVNGITTTYLYDNNGNVVNQASSDGLTVINEYNSNNQVVNTSTNGVTTSMEYDKYGNLIQTVEPNGATATTNYTNGRVGSECDSYNNCVTYTYYGNGQVKTETDANLNTTTYQYDYNGNVISEEINGEVTTFSYDPAGNLVSTTYPDGTTETFVYDKYSQQTSATNRDGVTTSTTYDAYGNTTSSTDGNGNITTYEYSDYYLTTTTTLPNGDYNVQKTDSNGNVISEESTNYYKEYTYFNNQVDTETLYSNDEVICTIDNAYDEKMNLAQTNDCYNQYTSYVYDEMNQVVSQTFNGLTTNYTYDLVGNITTQTIGEQVTSFTYDLNNNMLSETNAIGQVTTYKYDGNNNLVEYHNPEDLIITANYDHNGFTDVMIGEYHIGLTTNSDGLITSATLPNNTTVYREYDSYGNITKEINQLGYYKEFSYDNNYNLVSERDENGNTITYSYDVMNNNTQKVDAEGNTTDYEYDINSNVVKETTTDTTITYEYNNKEQIISETSNGYTKYYEYLNNNLVEIYDEQKTIESYTYGANNQVISQYVDGNYTNYTYDAYGNVVTETINGLTTTYTYNHINQVVSCTDFNNKVTNYTYNFYGNVTSEYVVNSEALTTYEYNKYNQLISEIYAEGQTYYYEYDNANNLITTTLPNNGKINYTYDAANNMVSEVDALGNTTYYRYDNVGNVVGEIHGADSIYQVSNNYTYNGNNQLTSVEDGNTNTTTYSYENENMTERVDANGDKFTYSYDQFNNLETVQSYNYFEAYTYDNYGNMTSSKIGDTETTYSYDVDNNLTSKTSSDETISYTYDQNHQVTETNYQDSNLNITYNNNLITKVNQDGQEISYSYDEIGRITSITYPDKTDVTYVYDKSNRITSVCQGEICYNYVYNELDQVTQVKQGNDITNVAYDLMGQVTGIEIIIDGQVHDTYTYVYDTLGNLIEEDHNGEVTKYTYDDNNQLLSYSNSEVSESYEYDKVGNRISKTTNGEKTEYIYENDLLVETTGYEPATYKYDDQGNLILKKEPKKITEYTYNNFNQLIQIEDTTGLKTTLSYDGLGNLIGSYSIKRDYKKEATISYLTNHVKTSNDRYEVEESLEYYKTYNPDVVDLWQQALDKTGYTVEELQTYEPTITEYSYVNDLTQEYPAPLVVNNDNVVYGNNKLKAGDTNYYYDGKNNVVATQKEEVTSYSYDPFGNTTNASYGYNSELHVNDLQYLRARYYDPKTGRFIQRDTYLGAVEEPLTQNRYTYCANNPIYYEDPSGNYFITNAITSKVYLLDARLEFRLTGEINWSLIISAGTVWIPLDSLVESSINAVTNGWNAFCYKTGIDLRVSQANVKTTAEAYTSMRGYLEIVAAVDGLLDSIKAWLDEREIQRALRQAEEDVEKEIDSQPIEVPEEEVSKVVDETNNTTNSNENNDVNVTIWCEEVYYVPYLDYTYNGQNGIIYE